MNRAALIALRRVECQFGARVLTNVIQRGRTDENAAFPGNVVISPHAIIAALALLGARQDASAQTRLVSALQFDGSFSDLVEALTIVGDRLRCLDEQPSEGPYVYRFPARLAFFTTAEELQNEPFRSAARRLGAFDAAIAASDGESHRALVDWYAQYLGVSASKFQSGFGIHDKLGTVLALSGSIETSSHSGDLVYTGFRKVAAPDDRWYERTYDSGLRIAASPRAAPTPDANATCSTNAPGAPLYALALRQDVWANTLEDITAAVLQMGVEPQVLATQSDSSHNAGGVHLIHGAQLALRPFAFNGPSVLAAPSMRPAAEVLDVPSTLDVRVEDAVTGAILYVARFGEMGTAR